MCSRQIILLIFLVGRPFSAVAMVCADLQVMACNSGCRELLVGAFCLFGSFSEVEALHVC